MWTCTNLITTIPPSVEACTLEEVLTYTHASPDDSARLVLLLAGCRSDLEKRLGRSLTHKTLQGTYQALLQEITLVSSGFSNGIDLLYGPVAQISIVEAPDGILPWAVLDPSLYHQDGNTLYLDDLSQFAVLDQKFQARVTYTAGPAGALDDADKLMLLQYIAHRYLYSEDDTLPDTMAGGVQRAREWVL